MIEINLLPWRTALRAQDIKIKKLFFMYSSMLLLLLVILPIVSNIILKKQEETVKNLQNQLTDLTAAAQQSPISPLLVGLQQMRSYQFELADFYKILLQKTPSGMVWHTIISKKSHVSLWGNADSFTVLSQFLAQFNAMNNRSHLNIVDIKIIPHSAVIRFHLQFMRSPSPILSQIKDHAAAQYL
jgi:hypothetical protein